MEPITPSRLFSKPQKATTEFRQYRDTTHVTSHYLSNVNMWSSFCIYESVNWVIIGLDSLLPV